MKKMFVILVSLFLIVGLSFAGEYQPENIEFERAFAAGNYESAVDLASTAVGKGNALNAQGYEAYKVGRLAKAKSLLERAIEVDDEQYWAYNTLGAILLFEGDISGAVEMFRKSIAVNKRAGDEDAPNRVRKAENNLAEAEGLL